MCWHVAMKNAVLEGEAAAEAVGDENEEGADKTVAKEAASGAEEKKNELVRDIREYTDEEFRQAYPDICAALIGKAKEGQIRHVRMLLEIIAGKHGDLATLKQRIGKTLGEMLLDELKRRQDEREAAIDAAEEEQRTQANDAVSEGAKSGGEAEHA